MVVRCEEADYCDRIWDVLAGYPGEPDPEASSVVEFLSPLCRCCSSPGPHGEPKVNSVCRIEEKAISEAEWIYKKLMQRPELQRLLAKDASEDVALEVEEEERDSVPLPPKPEVEEIRVLYLQPTKLDSVAAAMKVRWKTRLENEYNMKVDMVTEEPPLEKWTIPN